MRRTKLIIIIFIIIIKILGISILDLGEWDERFHANVAKNLAENPLRPSLIDDGITDLGTADWSQTDIWLHKPPLALWFMAGVIRLFGANEAGIRFFSLIFSILSIYLVYRIGKLLFNYKIGLTAALLFTINGLVYEVTSGRLAGDHVDSLFLLLIQIITLLSIQAAKSPDKLRIVLIGFLTGLAFLTKWTMVLFILPVIASILYFNLRSFIKLIFVLSSILVIAAMVSFPWVWYIFEHFPIQAHEILKGLYTPFHQVIHNHEGEWYFYFDKIRICINELIYIPLLFLVVKGIKHFSFERNVLISWIFVPLILLSLASTKREVYLLISAAPMFVTLSWYMHYLWYIRSKLRYLVITKVFIVLVYILAIRYSIERIKPGIPRFEKPEYRLKMEQLLEDHYFENPENIVIINEPKYMEIRYYYDIKAYRYLDDEKIREIKNKGYMVYSNSGGEYLIY